MVGGDSRHENVLHATDVNAVGCSMLNLMCVFYQNKKIERVSEYRLHIFRASGNLKKSLSCVLSPVDQQEPWE